MDSEQLVREGRIDKEIKGMLVFCMISAYLDLFYRYMYAISDIAALRFVDLVSI